MSRSFQGREVMLEVIETSESALRDVAVGIATVSIDGGVPALVDTGSSAAPGSLTSEPVFSASGLAPDVTPTLVITVTGTTTTGTALLTGGTNVVVDRIRRHEVRSAILLRPSRGRVCGPGTSAGRRRAGSRPRSGDRRPTGRWDRSRRCR